jgi:uncharacterized protein YjbI with pentapeptide repeats
MAGEWRIRAKAVVRVLQGASLEHAQLQGASLVGTQLQGAWLVGAFVWRAQAPEADDVLGAIIIKPEVAPKYRGLDCSGKIFDEICNWSEKSYAALKLLIPSVSKGLSPEILEPIARLEKPPYVQDDVSSKAWADLESSVRPDPKAHTKILKKIGCAADGAPYVIANLIPRLNHPLYEILYGTQEIATAFLDEAKCPGARGLSEENKTRLQGAALGDRKMSADIQLDSHANLQEIRDRDLRGAAGPGTAAR